MRALFLDALGDLRGGSQRSVRSIARATARRGHDVAVACPEGPFAERLAKDGLTVHHLPNSGWLDGALHQAGAANLVRLTKLVVRDRIDVVHTFQYGSHLLARMAADATGCGFVHTVIGPLSPGQRFGDGPLMAIAPAFAEDAMAAGASQAEVRVVPGQIDLGDFPRVPPASEPVVTLISRLDGHLVRSAEHFLQAIPLVQTPARFEVAGDGEALSRLRASAAARFLGHVEDLSLVHRRSRIVVGVGRALLEAMLAGVPCVCLAPVGSGGIVSSDTVDEMFHHDMSGRHAAPSKPELLAAALDRLLGDAAERVRLAAFGPAWVGERYDVEAAVPFIEAAWSRAVALHRRPGDSVRLLGRLAATEIWRTVRRRFRR